MQTHIDLFEGIEDPSTSNASRRPPPASGPGLCKRGQAGSRPGTGFRQVKRDHGPSGHQRQERNR